MLKQKLTDNPDGEENNRKARLENLEDKMLKMMEMVETITPNHLEKNPDSDDKPTFRIDPRRFNTIEGIVNEVERYSNWRDFVDEALALFITWWTEPPKTMNLIYEMWPDITEGMHHFWKTNPNTKDSYEQFKAGAEAYHKQKREGRTAVLNAAKGLEPSISF